MGAESIDHFWSTCSGKNILKESIGHFWSTCCGRISTGGIDIFPTKYISRYRQ